MLVLGYGSALAVLCWLARMMTWSTTSRHLADLGLLCAAATVVADLAEDAFLYFGERTEWCYVAAGAAALVIRRTGAPLAYSAAAVWGLMGVVVQNTAVRPNLPVALTAGLAAVAVMVLTSRTRRIGPASCA